MPFLGIWCSILMSSSSLWSLHPLTTFSFFFHRPQTRFMRVGYPRFHSALLSLCLTRSLKPSFSSRRVPYSVFKARNLGNFLNPYTAVCKIEEILTTGTIIGFHVARSSSSKHNDTIVTIYRHSIVPVLSSVLRSQLLV